MDFTNVTKALTARGFKVSSFETAKEAAEYLNTQIDGATVGFGGSITLEELGLYALLSGHNTVFRCQPCVPLNSDFRECTL